MIKVVFTYKTLKENLDELMGKFAKSADEKFSSTPSNIGIEMSKRIEGEEVYIVLDIYYNSVEDYVARTEHERSMDEWNEIWFSKDIKHTEVSVEVFEVLKEK